jgi:hypothetical protein
MSFEWNLISTKDFFFNQLINWSSLVIVHNNAKHKLIIELCDSTYDIDFIMYLQNLSFVLLHIINDDD